MKRARSKNTRWLLIAALLLQCWSGGVAAIAPRCGDNPAAHRDAATAAVDAAGHVDHRMHGHHDSAPPTAHAKCPQCKTSCDKGCASHCAVQPSLVAVPGTLPCTKDAYFVAHADAATVCVPVPRLRPPISL